MAAIERDLPKLRDRAALLVWPRTPPFETPDRNRWEQLFPSHRTVMFEGAGHYMQEDAPQQIVDAIRSWKQETG